MTGDTGGFDLEIEVSIPAPAQDVWDHLTDPDLLVRWWPNRAQTDPVPEGAYALEWDAGMRLTGTYREVDPPRRLVWTWAWDHETDPPRLVVMDLDETDGVTRLGIRHEAHDEEEQASYREGWEHFLGRLAALIEG